jgi:hypothetical protein
MFGHHTPDTRQPMIIRPCLLLALFLAVTAGAAAQQPAVDTGIACVSCVILQVPAASTATLDPSTRPLEGLTVVTDAADPAAREALAAIAAAGGEPGLVTAASAAVAPELLARAAVLIVLDLSDDDQVIFGLRTLATAARGARRGIRILAESDVPERARAYVDGRVERGPALARPAAKALVEASRQEGAAPALVTIEEVDWTALADFASQRAIGTEVVAAGTLTADQIVARHQAQRRRQEEIVRRTIARGTTTLLFEVPSFVAPVTVTAETVIYRQPGLTEMEQHNIRVNGASITGGSATSPPQLPLIEPERVGTPPLLITLNDAYTYSLAGRERSDTGDMYVVRFEPRDGGAASDPTRPGSSAHGRAWIDAASFALRRIETVQAGLQGPIVSSEQHERFAPFAVGAEQVWLPVEVRVYQRYEGAGHRTPIHRTIETPEHEINPPDFEARLQAAYASPHVMLRETPQGLRYLLRDRAESGTRDVAPRAGERIRTAVFGILVDPNITVPLPFAGFSYVDLNLFDTGAQLNAFFGGTYGQLSWSVPSIARTRWQAQGRAFGIAARYNDRSFRDGIEVYRENITQRPAHFSAGVTRPLLWRLRARFDYELDYTAFERADTTATTFIVPPDALVHGLVVAVEGESGPWSARAWWNPARRQRWREWGSTDGISTTSFDEARAFQRFGVAAARTLALGSTVSSRIEAAWMDGADLDRFSRYSFGAFENRLHGYPTASIRYDRGGVARSVTSWAGRGFRIDAFGDVAAVRDPGFGERLRGYPGVGAAVEAGGPLRTLWSVEWGYGFKARRSDGGQGTQSIRVTAYRTF